MNIRSEQIVIFAAGMHPQLLLRDDIAAALDVAERRDDVHRRR